MIRYADDFVVLCKSKEDAENIPNLLEDYLKERGIYMNIITISSHKTRVLNLRNFVERGRYI